MTLNRKILIVLLCCAAVAWLAGPTGRFLVILTFLLFGPGYLVERALPVTATPGWLVRPALWLGLSLSVVALVYQWTTLIGVALTPPWLSALTMACAAGVIWSVWTEPDRSTSDVRAGHRPGPLFLHHAVLPALALIGIFGLTLWTRFTQIQDLALPAWVDSIHHALMIRVAAEQGQAPYSLRPYLPVDGMPYHWGYHVFTAAVMRLSGVALPQVMLWEGQIFNALHALTCAALAAYLWRRPLAGVFAALIVGLISLMPSYYVSWGRYTQLTGLLVLPALAIVWHAGLRGAARQWWMAAAILAAGLSIIHFRVLIFACALLAALSIVWATGASWALLRARVAQSVAAAGLAVGLAAPWLWVVVSRALFPAFAQPRNLVSEGSYNAVNLGILWAGQNRLLVALALVVAFWGIARRRRVVVEQVGWVGILVVLANPWLASYLLPGMGGILVLWGAAQRRWIVTAAGVVLLVLNPAFVTLPYLWLISNDAVVISLFIPISVLIGGGACLLADRLERVRRAQERLPMTETSPVALHLHPVSARPVRPVPVQHALLVVGLGLALWGAWNMREVINPVTVFATRADTEAIAWVAKHTPTDARFLINAAPWLPGVSRGADGGWWLLPLTARWTSTPPALFIYGSPDYVRAVQERNEKIVALQPGDAPELYQLIRDEGITHIYLNSRTGPLSLAMFADAATFEKVYERGGISILAVRL